MEVEERKRAGTSLRFLPASRGVGNVRSFPNSARNHTPSGLAPKCTIHFSLMIFRLEEGHKRTEYSNRNQCAPMSERGHQRGGRGGRGEHRGGGGGRGRGGHDGVGRGGHTQTERPKKENILDLGKYMDKQITVKFTGGREVTGTLKGYDALMNLVLDDVSETVRDDEGNESSRPLGLVVARGTLLVLVSPCDGSEEIANPFLAAEEE